jgi:hypothetical protein
MVKYETVLNALEKSARTAMVTSLFFIATDTSCSANILMYLTGIPSGSHEQSDRRVLTGLPVECR